MSDELARARHNARAWRDEVRVLRETTSRLAEIATPENISKIYKIGARGQRRHPETRAMFAQLADALGHLREADVAIDRPARTERVEWGVRYGDGEIDHWTRTERDPDGGTKSRPYSREEVEAEIAKMREDYADPETFGEADDYEPMTLVHRTVVEFAPIVTDWEAAS